MKFIYSCICKIYCLFSTYIEDIFLKKFKVDNDLKKNGYFVIRNELNYILDIYKSKKIEINKYLKKLIFSKEEINKLLLNIFVENNLKDKITELTGFNYSVDFFTAYETISIPIEEKKLSWYANQPHRDKPYSKNTLKLIIPLQRIEEQNGPMEILNIESTKYFQKNKKNINFFKFIGNPNDIFIFKPNLCLHKAGIPEKNKNRIQMMLQLNPAKKWCFNEEIYNFQKIREPKFTSVRYLFNNKLNFFKS